jgi:uncharacterized protein (TIGR02284 family)
MYTDIDTLNMLIETCRDGHDGYQAAAHGMKDMEIKRLFGKIALERKEFEQELRKAIETLDGKPHMHGTFKGALHRGWIELRRGLGATSVSDILDLCNQGETVAVDNYLAALGSDLPPPIRELVTRQLTSIAKAREQVRDLEKAATQEELKA